MGSESFGPLSGNLTTSYGELFGAEGNVTMTAITAMDFAFPLSILPSFPSFSYLLVELVLCLRA